MIKRSTRMWLLLAAVALLAVLPPGFARDFLSWRSDGVQVRDTSVNQSSNHQGFNLFDVFTDIGSTAFSLYWKGALVGDTAPAGDNREQDPEIRDWAAWATALGNAGVPRPTFTPNVPQAWNPMVIDLDDANVTADHFLVAATLEPPTQDPEGAYNPAADRREQVIAAYVPETAQGLLNLSTRQNRVPPAWRVRTRDLASINPASLGVVTHPPILARVPAIYRQGGQAKSETRTVLYLVIGTGEGTHARVVCLNIPPPTPNPPPAPAPNRLYPAPNPAFFTPGGPGDVMWSYEVRARTGGGPVPVAGISFANVGTTSAPQPLLYLTTADGQLICLNAKAADDRTITQDGDGAIVNDPQSAAERDGIERWVYQTPATVPTPQGFAYGMAPAVARVPLSGAYPASTGIVTDAQSKWQADDWMVFVADTWGTFRGFDARGVTINDDGTLPNPLTQWKWRIRWKDSFGAPAAPRPSLVAGETERFLVPPLVYQGNTPMTTSTGALVNGSTDVGFDDEVIFASDRGRLYTFHALGGALETAGGANRGRPHFDPEDEDPRGTLSTGSELRWLWPDQDTAPLTVSPADPAAATQEPRPWPRQLAPFSPPAPAGELGPVILNNADYFVRSALAVSLGANSSPDSGTPNLDIGDDLIYVPWQHRQAAAPAAGMYGFYEYIGSLKPYGFVQAERPIGTLTRVTATFVDAVTNVARNNVEIPLDHVRVGTVKTSAVPITQVPTAPGFNANDFTTPDDTVYIVSQSWFDTASNTRFVMPFNATITLEYDDLGGVARTDGPFPFPSAYRHRIPGENPPVSISRVRSSLGVHYNRLQLRSRVDTPQDEGVAQVLAADFDAGLVRPPSMYGAAGASTGGTLVAPSWYRGRLIALTSRLRWLRVIPGYYDARVETGTLPVAPFQSRTVAGQTVVSDPGEFIPGDAPWDDRPLLTDVGASVTMTDGWLYVTYRNGHIRAYANQNGGAPGSGNPGSPPIYQLPPPANTGNVVRAPFADPTTTPGAGIFITSDPANPTDTTKYLHKASADRDAPLLLEYGQTIHVVVDFGPASQLASGPIDNPNQPNPQNIDPQVLENDIQAQIRSSNGAVQQLPGANRGVRPRIVGAAGQERILAVIPVFAGVASPTNPLTPGTPLLWERDSNGFTGELTYDLQVTQQGLQWLWGPWPNPGGMGNRLDPKKQHFWEAERNNGATRFPTTAGMNGGTPNWDWVDNPATPHVDNEWAPLVSYNNPLSVYYDPDPQDNTVFGLISPSGSPANEATLVNQFTNRRQHGRKNGDPHETQPVDGSRSSTGRPAVPVVGMAIDDGAAKQVVFGDHGRTTSDTTTENPEAGVLRVADRSFMAAAGRQLQVRVQRAQLTKIGRGAYYGNAAGNAQLDNLPGAPVGSFEQNQRYLDDGPSGAYSSIPPSRLIVTKQGTNVDLAAGPVPIPGRQQNGTNWDLPAPAQMEKLAVQVDIPQYQPDDIYATRWRAGGALGAPDSTGFNPFFPGGNLRGEAARALFDRAEKRAVTANPVQLNQPPTPAPGEDVGNPNAPEDDRLRRCVIFVDANGNGQLDLLPTYREAYRTFGVQVVVKPDIKIETNQGLLDLGDLWHGKKQPGLGVNNPAEIREWQWMQAQAQAPGSMGQRIAQFYSQYWRPVELRNTGNVNLAFVKPELLYTANGSTARLIGLPGQGNDPWRALSFINQRSTNQLAALSDPQQIFLRTSFDDQMLPDASTFYGGGLRGVWLQKAPIGAALPGSVTYAEQAPTGLPAARDPSMPTAAARDTFVSLNIPTGTPLGQYAGSIRFFNDRTVVFSESQNGPGYTYAEAATPGNGMLERDNTGEPQEPTTDPPVRIKVRVVENMINGRGDTPQQAESQTQRDKDRRIAPTAIADAAAAQGAPPGQVRRILLGFPTDRNAVQAGRSYRYDLAATQLSWDTNRELFPFDELPLVRDALDPWRQFTGALSGFQLFTNVTAPAYGGAAAQVEKPSLTQDGTGLTILAATERRSRQQGQDEYRMFYQGINPAPGQPILIYPGGQPPDVRVPRVGLRMVAAPAQSGTANNWIAIYAMNQGVRRNLAYTWSSDPTQGVVNTPGDPLTSLVGRNWAPESLLATPRSLSTVNDPQVFVTPELDRAPAALTALPGQSQVQLQENSRLPVMTWVGYAGTSQLIGRTDIHLSRYRPWALARAGQRGQTVPLGQSQGKAEDYALVGFPRTTNDILTGNPERTRYTAGGLEWLWQQGVQVYIGRADRSNTTNGSLARPLALLTGITPRQSSNGELVYTVPTATALGQIQVIVDPAAGIVRFSRDTRAIAGALIGANTPNTPDPVITADYTPTTLRVTNDGMSANDPVIVPVLSTPGDPVVDASWYRQQLNPAAWQAGEAVPGRADRLWVFWRRSAGRVSGGPTVFYKVLRPGIRVRAGAVYSLGGLTTTLGQPEEVNIQNGTLFFPHSYEGQTVEVTYDASPAPNTQRLTEVHTITWQDETGALPVPMDFSVNEGSLDAFASYEAAQMGSGAFRKLEKIWLFWSSSRGSGGEVMFATLAPRIGAEANVGGSLPFQQFIASSLSSRMTRQALQQFQAYERRKPFTLPPLVRRGPYVPRSGRVSRAANSR